eukprot:300037-Amphidinium_carterae.1
MSNTWCEQCSACPANASACSFQTRPQCDGTHTNSTSEGARAVRICHTAATRGMAKRSAEANICNAAMLSVQILNVSTRRSLAARHERPAMIPSSSA